MITDYRSSRKLAKEMSAGKNDKNEKRVINPC